MVDIRFTPVTELDARAILAWRYEPPYTTYNDLLDESALTGYVARMLDSRSPYYAARLVASGDWERQPPDGFFAFGSSCEVASEPDPPFLKRPDGSLSIGLGLRPGLTGHGLGLAFVQAGLSLARGRYHPTLFRLFVYAWNRRAITVYERAGFTEIGRAGGLAEDGQPAFIEMTRQL